MNMPGHLGKILSINEKLLYILMKMKKKLTFKLSPKRSK